MLKESILQQAIAAAVNVSRNETAFHFTKPIIISRTGTLSSWTGVSSDVGCPPFQFMDQLNCLMVITVIIIITIIVVVVVVVAVVVVVVVVLYHFGG